MPITCASRPHIVPGPTAYGDLDYQEGLQNPSMMAFAKEAMKLLKTARLSEAEGERMQCVIFRVDEQWQRPCGSERWPRGTYYWHRGSFEEGMTFEDFTHDATPVPLSIYG